jgi:hypothetical protein
MEFYSGTKNEILSFAGKWIELENIILLYVEYRLNTNTAILWKIGQTKGRSHMRERVKEGS